MEEVDENSEKLITISVTVNIDTNKPKHKKYWILTTQISFNCVAFLQKSSNFSYTVLISRPL